MIVDYLVKLTVEERWIALRGEVFFLPDVTANHWRYFSIGLIEGLCRRSAACSAPHTMTIDLMARVHELLGCTYLTKTVLGY